MYVCHCILLLCHVCYLQLTRDIVREAKGCVLVIDEAYGLHSNAGVSGKSADPFRTSVINTLVEEVQNNPGCDQCVLMLGYEHEMNEMFRSANPGLRRRFDAGLCVCVCVLVLVFWCFGVLVCV